MPNSRPCVVDKVLSDVLPALALLPRDSLKLVMKREKALAPLVAMMAALPHFPMLAVSPLAVLKVQNLQFAEVEVR